MPEGHDTIIEVSNIMSFVLYTQILKQSVLKPASPGITLNIAQIFGITYSIMKHVKKALNLRNRKCSLAPTKLKTVRIKHMDRQ